jgi:hypothetical protein
VKKSLEIDGLVWPEIRFLDDPRRLRKKFRVRIEDIENLNGGFS